MPGEHGFGQCNCQDESASLGAAKWLNGAISIDQVSALNVEEGDIKKVVKKHYDERLNDEAGFVRTPDDDNELLVNIPFDSPVQLQSFFIIGGEAGRHPMKVRLFANPVGDGAMDIADV